MKRLFASAIFANICLASDPTGTRNIAQCVSDDALIVVGARRPAVLDEDYKNFTTAIGLDWVRENAPSVKVKLLESIGLAADSTHIEFARPVFVSVGSRSPMQDVVLSLPSKDPRALADALGGKHDPDKDTWNFNLNGRPLFGALSSSELHLGMSSEQAKRMTAVGSSLAAKLKPEEVKSFENLDFFIWINAEKIIPLFRPQIDGLMGMGLMMQMGAGEIAEAEARSSKQRLDTLLDGLSTLLIGLDMNQTGLTLRALATAKPASKLVRQTDVIPTGEPLFRGLASSSYVFSAAMTTKPQHWEEIFHESAGVYFESFEKSKKVDAESLREFQLLCIKWLKPITRVAFSIDAPPATTESMAAITVVADLEGGSDHLDLTREIVEKSKILGKKVVALEEANQFFDALSYSNSAELIEEVRIDKFAIKTKESLEVEDQEQIEKIFGKDGLVFRIGIVENKTAFATMGGADYTASVIKSIKAKSSPRDDDPAIRKVAEQLARQRNMAAFINADALFALVDRFSREFEEPLPFKMDQIGVPIGMTSTGALGWSQNDVYLPAPLIAGIMKAITSMQADPPAESESEIEENK